MALWHAWLVLPAAGMTSGKAASQQPGSLHTFLCQLRVRDDLPLKLFSRFSILLKPPGHSSARQQAPPHLPVRSVEVPAARAPGALDLGQKSRLLLLAGSLKLSHTFLFPLAGLPEANPAQSKCLLPLPLL